MIKLRDILNELKSTKNLDKVNRNKPYTIIWNSGELVAMTKESQPPLSMSKLIPMEIDELKKSIRIQDWDDWSSFKDGK
jgi:hypothetical protein